MSFYYIDNKEYFNLCLNENFNIIRESNDWLYDLVPLPVSYHHLAHAEGIRNHIIHTPRSYVPEKVIPLISGFVCGLHAFCGMYSILLQYLENIERYTEYKFIVYKNLQKGVKDLVDFFIDKERIIYIDADVVYKFDEIHIIRNELHSFYENTDIRDRVIELIQKTILIEDVIVPKNLYQNNLCIFKHLGSGVKSVSGSISRSGIDEFVNKSGFYFVEPSEYSEIEIIHIINSCGEKLLLSWGTPFQKNFIYIGDQIQHVIVPIIGNIFLQEYNELCARGKMVYHFKNAVFHYYIVNELEILSDDFITKINSL